MSRTTQQGDHLEISQVAVSDTCIEKTINISTTDGILIIDNLKVVLTH